MPTKIEWVKNPDGTQGEVWNPVSGCTPVTEGCRNCYAKEFHKRFNKEPFEKIKCHLNRLDKPLHWKKPRMVFVNSMSDLFHPGVPFKFVEKVWRVMAKYPQHTFVVLTKRPAYMKDFIETLLVVSFFPVLPNLWLGVSVSNQEDADEFIPQLLQTPAAKRFVSYEPALGGIDLNKKECLIDKKRFRLTLGNYLDWVICGGESGANARPCHPDWVRKVRDDCVNAGVPFFLKQLNINGKLVHMPELDGQIWNQLPERG